MDEEINEDISLDESLEPLTTVIGIICREGIVLATDSQASIRRNVEMKRHGIKKSSQ